jgi:hypothetical protein
MPTPGFRKMLARAAEGAVIPFPMHSIGSHPTARPSGGCAVNIANPKKVTGVVELSTNTPRIFVDFEKKGIRQPDRILDQAERRDHLRQEPRWFPLNERLESPSLLKWMKF